MGDPDWHSLRPNPIISLFAPRAPPSSSEQLDFYFPCRLYIIRSAQRAAIFPRSEVCSPNIKPSTSSYQPWEFGAHFSLDISFKREKGAINSPDQACAEQIHFSSSSDPSLFFPQERARRDVARVAKHFHGRLGGLISYCVPYLNSDFTGGNFQRQLITWPAWGSHIKNH